MADSVALISPGGGPYTAPNCLSLQGFNASPASSPYVNHGFFFGYDNAIGNSGYWDWLESPKGGGYRICDGDGGAHGVLAGLSPGGSSGLEYVQTGNFWASDGAAHPVGSYAANEGPRIGEWGHHAFAFFIEGGANVVLVTYWNGLATGVWLMWTVASGTTRKYPSAGSGSGNLYVGAGSHNNATCYLAQVRGIESANPLGTYLQPFIPPRALGPRLMSAAVDPDFLADYTAQSGVVADQSYGWTRGAGTTRYRHPGELANWYNGQQFPAWTTDAGCIVGKAGDFVNSAGYAKPQGTLPVGARIFDGCDGPPQDWFWQSAGGPNMNINGGTDFRASLGALTWTQAMIGGDNVTNWTVPVVGRAWARRNGFFRCYEPAASICYADNSGVLPSEVRISRMNTSDMGHVHMVIAGNDRNNFLALGTLQAKNGSNNSTIYIFNYVSGSNTLGFGTSLTPANTTWKTLRTVRSGGSNQTVTVYVDNGAGGWQSVGTYTDTTYNTNASSKCGFANLGGQGVAGGSNWAGTDFTVL